MQLPAIEELTNVINLLSIENRSGHDGILSKALDSKDFLVSFLVIVCNNIVRKEIFPDILKIHKIVPISKGKRAVYYDLFRPIAVLSVIDNVFERI